MSQLIRFGKHALAGYLPVPGATRAVSFRGTGGAPLGPSTDLFFNFADDKLLVDQINGTILTLTRASPASFVDELGVIKETIADEQRFTHDPVTLQSLGLLLEDTRLNHSLNNTQMQLAPWFATGEGTGVLPVVTANAGVAPDGLTTATRLQLDDGGGVTAGDNSQWRQSITIPNLQQAVHSIYMRSFDGNSYAVECMAPDGTAGVTVTVVPGQWTRFEAGSTGDGTANDVGVRLSGAGTSDTVADILVWGDQNEGAAGGAQSTSLILNAGVANTRQQDLCSTLDVSWYNNAEGTLYGKAAEPSGVSNGFENIASISSGAEQHQATLKIGSTTNGQGQQQSGAVAAAANVTDAFLDLQMKIALRISATDTGVAADGLLGGPFIPQNAMPVGVDRLIVGAGATQTGPWNGPIAEIAYSRQALTDGELIGVTL